MTRPALSTTGRPQKVAARARREKEKSREQTAQSLQGQLSQKKFSELTAEQKDDLLQLLALQAGLILGE